MRLDRFVSTEKSLAGPGWVKPPHLIAAIAERRRRRQWKMNGKRAFCPTGDGGGIDNSCSASDGSSSPQSQSSSSGASKVPVTTTPSPRSRPVTKEDVEKILEKISQNPWGFSLDPLSAEQPSTGIMVSEFQNDDKLRTIKIKASEINSDDTAKAFAQWISNNSDLLVGDSSRFIGGWKAGDEFYIDVATRFEPGDAAAALEAGRKAGQLAVFNLGTFKETWVQYEKGDKRKPDNWDSKFARAKKDAAVTQVYDESSPDPADEDWVDELNRHGKTTVRAYNPSERELPNEHRKNSSREIRHSEQGDHPRLLSGLPKVRRGSREVAGQDPVAGMVRGRARGEAGTVQRSAAPSAAGQQEDGWLNATVEARALARDASALATPHGKPPKIEFRDIGRAVASYSADDDTIYVSPALSLLDISSLADSASRGWLSQPNPVLHEYSHKYHLSCDPAGYEASCRRELSDEQRSLIAEKVSGYAATNASEFMAEYIAGRLSGKQYSPDIKKIVKYVTDGAVNL